VVATAASRVRPRVLLWTAVAAYGAGFAALSVLRHEAFSTGRFDLGNMVQAVWSTAHGHPLEATSLGGEQFVRLGAHFDPILALFALPWRIWPSPALLLTVQAVVVALGAVPVFWLARKHLASERVALGFALAYLLLPPLQWMTLSEFHPVALATPLLLFALWYLDEGRLFPFAAFAALAAATKEHVGLAVAAFGLSYALAHRRLWTGAAIAGAGIAVTALAVGVVIPHFSPEGGSSFYERYSAVGGSPSGVVETAVSDPGAIVSELVDRRGLTYVFQLLLPLAGLPLLAPVVLVAAVPELGLNLLSKVPTQTSIHFHYSATVVAVLAAAAVLGSARLVRAGAVSGGRLAAVAVALSLTANYALGPIPIWRAFPGGERLGTTAHLVNEHDRIAARAIRLLPAAATISASNSLGGHLSERRRFLSFPRLDDAGWVAVDETRPGNADRIEPLPYAAAIARLRRNPDWRLVFQEDGVLVFRRIS
jgi:uncharacterized membrane protein